MGLTLGAPPRPQQLETKIGITNFRFLSQRLYGEGSEERSHLLWPPFFEG